MTDPVPLSVATAVLMSNGTWITLAPNSLAAVIDPSFADAQTGQLIVPGEAWMQFVEASTGQVYAAPMRCIFGVKLHAAVTPGVVTVTNPGSQAGTVGTPVSLPVTATDSVAGQVLTYSATGLPAGLSVNTATGVISGTPSAAGTSHVQVTATDAAGSTSSASFDWTIS